MSRSADEAKYRVGMVARLTGLSPHVLRVWERRYQAVLPSRTPGGGRLYSDADVARLKRLSELVAEGHSIGAVATLPTEELARIGRAGATLEREPPRFDGPELRERFLERLAAFDAVGAEQLVVTAALVLEPRVLLAELVGPILVEIGNRWKSGELRIAHEHAASAMFRGLLGTLARIYSASAREGVIVAATPSGERHELGALMASIVAVTLGYRVVYLGPDLPAEEIGFAVSNARAKYLLLSLTCLPATSARRELARVIDSLSPNVAVVLGGAAAPDDLPRTKKLGDFEALAELLRRGDSLFA